MVLLDCGSGLRCGELIGLQWRDFDFARKQMSVTRSVVDMVSGKVKTEASQKMVPLGDIAPTSALKIKIALDLAVRLSLLEAVWQSTECRCGPVRR